MQQMQDVQHVVDVPPEHIQQVQASQHVQHVKMDIIVQVLLIEVHVQPEKKEQGLERQVKQMDVQPAQLDI